jgi:hypothetical protein
MVEHLSSNSRVERQTERKREREKERTDRIGSKEQR